MLNKQLDDIQKSIYSLDNYQDYLTSSLEVSEDIYSFLKQQCKSVDSIIEYDKCPTLFGIKVVINPLLEGFEYKIVRKERGLNE